MTTHPTVRPAVPDDADGIAEVHIRTWQETYAHLLPAAYLDGLDVAARAEQWRGSLGDASGAPTVVALDDDRIVGVALAGPARDEDPPRPFQLYAIDVVASAHGTGAGAGQALLRRGRRRLPRLPLGRRRQPARGGVLPPQRVRARRGRRAADVPGGGDDHGADGAVRMRARGPRTDAPLSGA